MSNCPSESGKIHVIYPWPHCTLPYQVEEGSDVFDLTISTLKHLADALVSSATFKGTVQGVNPEQFNVVGFNVDDRVLVLDTGFLAAENGYLATSAEAHFMGTPDGNALLRQAASIAPTLGWVLPVLAERHGSEQTRHVLRTHFSELLNEIGTPAHELAVGNVEEWLWAFREVVLPKLQALSL